MGSRDGSPMVTETFTHLDRGRALATFLMLPIAAETATVANPICPNNIALFNQDNGQDIGLRGPIRGPPACSRPRAHEAKRRRT